MPPTGSLPGGGRNYFSDNTEVALDLVQPPYDLGQVGLDSPVLRPYEGAAG